MFDKLSSICELSSTRKEIIKNSKIGFINLSQLKKIEITIEVEVGEDEKLFGSVTNKDIHKAILEKGIEIERNSIELEVPIKSLGIYDVNVNIAKGLSEKIKVYVIQA